MAPPDLRRHRRPRQSAARRSRQGGAGSRNRRRPGPLPRHPAFVGLGCGGRGRQHVRDATEGPAARFHLPQGLCLPGAARPEFRRVAVSPAARRIHRPRARLSRHADRARSLRRPGRPRPLRRPARGDLQDVEGVDPGSRQMPQCRRQARRAGDAAARLRLPRAPEAADLGAGSPPPGVPISKPASRPSAPSAACSKAIFRRTKASAAIR